MSLGRLASSPLVVALLSGCGVRTGLPLGDDVVPVADEKVDAGGATDGDAGSDADVHGDAECPLEPRESMSLGRPAACDGVLLEIRGAGGDGAVGQPYRYTVLVENDGSEEAPACVEVAAQFPDGADRTGIVGRGWTSQPLAPGWSEWVPLWIPWADWEPYFDSGPCFGLVIDPADRIGECATREVFMLSHCDD